MIQVRGIKNFPENSCLVADTSRLQLLSALTNLFGIIGKKIGATPT